MVVSLLGTSDQLSDFIQPVQENQAMTSESLSLTIYESTSLKKINGWISILNKTTTILTLSKNADWTKHSYQLFNTKTS